MAQQTQPDPQINLLLSDFNTRLREMEERNRVVKERVLLLGQNLITSRDESDKDIEQLKADTAQIKRDLEKIKSLIQNILSETDKFARKDEMILIERMLKDFQPIEFVRTKDVEEMINKFKFPEAKENIKTQKASKEDGNRN
jgi:hypothetical protein